MPELKSPPGSVRMWGKFDFNYNLEDSGFYTITAVEMPLITVGYCYLDLSHKVIRSGVSVARYDSGWSNIIIGGDSCLHIIDFLRDQTGYEINDDAYRPTPDEKYYKVVVTMKDGQTPYLTMLSPTYDNDDDDNDDADGNITGFDAARLGCVED